MTIQWIFIPFALFALSRVLLRLRDGTLSFGFFLFWIVIFSLAFVAVLSPDSTTKVANFLGIGRGVDVVLYASIFLLFYLVFRLYVMMEGVRHEVSELVRQIALKEFGRSQRRKSR
ncbi:MAG: DUF2304 family protein [bacterium]|nr:DUF2304 family protein [bacterium]